MGLLVRRRIAGTLVAELAGVDTGQELRRFGSLHGHGDERERDARSLAGLGFGPARDGAYRAFFAAQFGLGSLAALA